MSNTHIFIGHTIAALVLAACLSRLPVAVVQAQGYQLDFDSMQMGVSELSGGDSILQGGTSPLQTFGTADEALLLPLAAVAACGNGMREEGEACDGDDIGSATCASFGFRTGTVSCGAACSIITSECSDPIISSSSASSAAQSSPGQTQSHASVHGNAGGSGDVPAVPAIPEGGAHGHANSASASSHTVRSRASSASSASETDALIDSGMQPSSASGAAALGEEADEESEGGMSADVSTPHPAAQDMRISAVGAALAAAARVMAGLASINELAKAYVPVPVSELAGAVRAAMLPAMRAGLLPFLLLGLLFLFRSRGTGIKRSPRSRT